MGVLAAKLTALLLGVVFLQGCDDRCDRLMACDNLGSAKEETKTECKQFCEACNDQGTDQAFTECVKKKFDEHAAQQDATVKSHEAQKIGDRVAEVSSAGATKA